LNNLERIICLPCKYRESEDGLRIDNDKLCQARTTFEKIQAWIQARYHIREMVQIVEMLSLANLLFTKQELAKKNILREPTSDDLANHYMIKDGDNPSGRELFKKKWPFIWWEIISSKNHYYAGCTFGHKPNLFECYEQYVFYGGLESFWDRHKLTEKKDFVAREEKKEPTAIAA
jgi:hypothetical protein